MISSIKKKILAAIGYVPYNCPGCEKSHFIGDGHDFKFCYEIRTTAKKGTHPDAVQATKIFKELQLDPDIAAIIDSPYVYQNNLLLAQIIRRLPPKA